MKKSQNVGLKVHLRLLYSHSVQTLDSKGFFLFLFYFNELKISKASILFIYLFVFFIKIELY